MTPTHTFVKRRSARWGLVAGALVGVLVAIPARPQSQAPASTPGMGTPQDLVDALHAAFGEHRARAVHAKACCSTAVKIRGATGDVDIVTHSFNGFPVATSDEFATFLRAIGASGPGVAHPTPIEDFLDHHPIAKRFVTSQKPPPVSYATAAYFGVNAFKFINGSGRTAYVRYRFVPQARALSDHSRGEGETPCSCPGRPIRESSLPIRC